MVNSYDGSMKHNQSVKIPLLKVLMSAGLGSRRHLAQLIMENKVVVDGRIAQNLSHPVDPAVNTISIDGKKVQVKPIHKIVIMLNKPPGTLSTTCDDKGRKTVIDILPQSYQGKGLYPVGRLDMDSIGLLLITNDGDLTYRLTHPKFEHEKEYLVTIKDPLLPEEKSKLEKGVEIEGEVTCPAKIKEMSVVSYPRYSIIIHEGRKNQIRRMFESVGHPVLALQRIRIGGLNLGSLASGSIKELNEKDIRRLLQKNADSI
jgi:23S rRNA pseudouridine2605 synthase